MSFKMEVSSQQRSSYMTRQPNLKMEVRDSLKRFSLNKFLKFT